MLETVEFFLTATAVRAIQGTDLSHMRSILTRFRLATEH
ncbi:hypothetical protein Q31a_24960 [Aureliella helgolandensis]|uniref:Uncharacterized protein n=1 Tax=Aureliella helgolandensis TaxID=2527968 RepID=A0A518G6G6_9BACT|nr:hypothetical protein Q31a_24960 [Aureliella helgolandensis]